MKNTLKWLFLVVVIISLVLISACGEAETNNDDDDVHEHEMSEWIIDTEATCTAEGKKHIECTECEKKLLDDVIPKTAHTESDWIIETEATNQTPGSKYKQCTVCKEKLSTEVIPANGPMDDIALAQYVQERTVAIYINGELMGSGFFTDEDGTVVTCFHVLETVFGASIDSATIEIGLSNNARYSLQRVLKFDHAYDLAVFRIDTKGQKMPYFTVAGGDQPLNAKVYACGYALVFSSANFTSGNISTVSHPYGLADAYLQTAPISGGNSGGPLVNGYGEVVAVNAAHYINGENMNVAIKLSNLDDLRVVEEKTLSNFMKWYNDETRDSLKIWYWSSDDEDFTGNAFYSYLHTYQEVTGTKCEFSCDYSFYEYTDIPDSYKKNGFHGTCYYYTYVYTRSQYNAYIEYLEAEGYEYKSEDRFSDDSYIEYYYSDITESYVEIYIYTDAQTGDRMIQMNAYQAV